MRQDFLGFVTLMAQGAAGIRAHGSVGATDGRTGCNKGAAVVDGHVSTL